MCGIAGILNFDHTPVSQVILKNMADSIRHRGPDGEGFFIEGEVGLAHRRLSILDLSASGNQPMLSRDGRYALVYNGEIYNFQQLRLELQSHGHTFHSRTDSEVVLSALSHWGTRALDRFNGMFAFALWDNREKTLLLARDRYGIKPLYYARVGNVLMFASEVKAFLKHPSFQAKLDKSALVEYLTFQNFYTDRTLWNDVRILPQGHYWKMDVSGRSELKQYWDFNFSEPTKFKRDEEYVEELKFLFNQAVNRQLVSDVEVGSYLSSGIDSGSVTAIAALQLPYMKTFTIGFDLRSASGIELAFDEREKAEYMSYLFKTEHYEMVLKAGDMERALPAMAWHLEEPRVGQSYPNFYAAKLASKFCKVVLSGTGGDELFGGYPWRYYGAATSENFDQYLETYYHFWQRLMTTDELRRMLNPIWKEAEGRNPKEIFRSVFRAGSEKLTRPEDYINHSLYFEAKTFLHGIFVVDDKLSMANSLEARIPFMDNDLVDFAMRLPVHMKLGNLKAVIASQKWDLAAKEKYFEKTKDGKLILRQAFSSLVTEKISGQVKQGFSAPDASWFKGESIDHVRKTILTNDSPIFDVMDRSVVHELVGEHLEGRKNRRLLIWSLLSLHHSFLKFLR